MSKKLVSASARAYDARTRFLFWFSDSHGLIRQRRIDDLRFYPEVWRDKRWQFGTPYVMDAITGMGEDAHSCGEWASSWDDKRAAVYAAQHGVDLYAVNPDDEETP